MLFALFTVRLAFGAGIPSVEIDGNTYSNISKVYVSGARIIIIYPGGGTSSTADKLPADFVSSWLNSSAVASAKAGQNAALDRAIAAGAFREVQGTVYDTRKAGAGFAAFNNVKLIQVLASDSAALIDPNPGDVYSRTVFYVKHLPPVGDTEFLTFTALPDGTYTYENKAGNERTVRAYDYGRIVSREDIPVAVLNGQVAFASLPLAGVQRKDVIATLPDSTNLVASGSGFFVSADGYLITNHHVVKGARRLQIQIGGATYPASVVRVDRTNDLALVKVSGSFNPLPISPSNVALGDQVFTIGFPDVELEGTQPKYTAGTISSLAGIRDDPTQYQISVPVQPGNSGGPLVDLAGAVRGVIVARLDDFAALRAVGSLPQNVNYAVKGSLLRQFLAAGHEVNPSQPSLGPAGAAVATVQKSVALVLVY